MNKKIFTLFILLLLLPVTALAEGDAKPNNLYVGNQSLSVANDSYWTTDADGNLTQSAADQSWHVKYDPSTATLTLSGATIQGGPAISASYGAGIYALSGSNQPVSLTIELIGENTITGNYGIYVDAQQANTIGTDASLIIQSSNNGSLIVTGTGSNGLYVISGTGNASLTIENASVDANTSSQLPSYAGVCIQSSSTASTPTLSLAVNGGSLTASGSEGNDGIQFYVGSPQATGAITSLTVSENAIVDARTGGISAKQISNPINTDISATGSNGGIVFDGKNGTMYGDVTLQEDLEIGEGETLTVPEGASLTVPEETTLTNNGRIINYGTINGTVTGTVAIPLTKEMITVADATYTYTGVAVTPYVTVEKEGITYIKDTDYWVSYSDNINAGTAKVTVTPKEGSRLLGSAVEKEFTIEKAVATLSFTKETVSATIGETVENTLTVTPEGVAVSYSSSDETVATVDASTGAITLVGAGKTTITATISDPNYTRDHASYILMVSKVTLAEDEITAVGVTNISIEKNGTPFKLTAQVTANDLGTGGKWEWTSDNETVATVAAEQGTLRAATSTSSATVTPLSVGTATITATYEDNKYVGSVTYTVTVTKPYVPDPISYYNIYVEDVCDGVEVTTSKNVVREGGSISLYVEKDTAHYTFDNFKVYYKRSYYGYWEELKEGTQPGEYPIRNIWTHIYVKAEGAEEKEDPTGIEQIEGVKVYTKDGSLYVQTPQREQVIIVSMSGAVVKNEEQVGLKQYHGLQPGIYIVRVGDKAYKLRLN